MSRIEPVNLTFSGRERTFRGGLDLDDVYYQSKEQRTLSP